MTVHHHLAALLVTDRPGSGWPAAWVHRLLNPSGAGVPPELRTTAADYWWDCTLGLVALRGTVAHQVVLPPDDPAWLASRSGADPGVAHARGLADLVRTHLHPDSVSAATGLIVVSSLPTARAYATDVRLGRRRIPTAFVGVGTSHMVLCHELGHVFGFEHPWGLYTEVLGVASREYGSPYCLMGTARRFTEVCTPVEGWPDTPNDAEPGFFDVAGPRLALAELVAWLLRGPERMPGHLPWLQSVTVPPGGTVRIRVTHQDGPGELPRAVLAATPDGRRFVVEVRRPLPHRAVDWDARLDLRRRHDERPGFPPSADLHDGPGVVLHKIEDLPGPTGIRALLAGAHLRRPRRSVYIGAIPLPPAGDLDITSPDAAPWVVRLLDATPAGAVTLEIGARPGVPTARLDWRYVDDDRHHVHLQAYTEGFERPELRWRAAGVQLPWLSVGDGRVEEARVGRVVTPAGAPAATRREPVDIRLQSSWDQLCVHADPAGGSYTARVTLQARDWLQLGIAAEATVRLRLGG